MIPDMWYAVLESREVKPGKPYAFRRLNADLVFWRDNAGQVVVMEDRCPHRRSKLSPGKIVDGHIQCHFHGFQYDREGACQLIPANGRTGPKPRIFRCQTYPAQEGHGFIWVWYGEPRANYPPLPYFDDLDGLSYATFQKQWNVHYTRALESLLDVSHLPFVHANTIGRGNQTLVNGPYTTLENDQLRVWVSNQPDAGLSAIKPSQVPPPERPADLWLNFPNVWQLRLSDQVRNVTIAAPIDEENVMLYQRNYQGMVKLPILGRLLNLITMMANRYVLHEDEVIVTTQDPKKAGLDIGEAFIPGDRPIALYLMHRRDLMMAAQQQSVEALTAGH